MKKLVVGSIILMLVTLGWSNRSLGEEAQEPRAELRVVDKSPINWASITYNVFEHLITLDKDGKLVPRLATGWRWLDDRTFEVTLRHGVTFHNGEVFDAEIVKLNWDEQRRLQQPFRGGNFMNFKPESRLEIVDPYTVRFVFPEPDGGALAKLTAMHMGLNSGVALVGSTRFEGMRGSRWTFTASGTVTNLVSRLADIARAGEILIGPETARRLGERYRLQRLGWEQLKNIDTLVEIHCLGGHLPSPHPGAEPSACPTDEQ